jgi:hypothetical protein
VQNLFQSRQFWLALLALVFGIFLGMLIFKGSTDAIVAGSLFALFIGISIITYKFYSTRNASIPEKEAQKVGSRQAIIAIPLIVSTAPILYFLRTNQMNYVTATCVVTLGTCLILYIFLKKRGNE